MARYYFDFFQSDTETFVDDVGSDLADAQAAQAEAIQAAVEWLKDNASIGAEVTIQIRDGAPQPLFAVTASLAMHPTKKAPFKSSALRI